MKYLRKSNGNNGAGDAAFVLVFTVVIITILLIITSSIFSFVSSQIKVSRDEYESAKALYAADTGIECVRFYQNQNRVFDTTKSQQSLNCGVGTITAGLPTPSTECTDYTY